MKKIRIKQGFTLIELLVVIAIIAILAAILFPVFANARAKARESRCTNNMKQIVMAFLQYAQDWDGGLPTYDTWMRATSYRGKGLAGTYIETPGKSPDAGAFKDNGANTILHCPEVIDYAYHAADYSYACDYGVNLDGLWNVSGLTPWASLEKAQSPAVLIMLGELKVGQYYIRRPPASPAPETGRHNSGTNLAFCDGHVKWYGANDVIFQPISGASSPNYANWVGP